MEVGFVAERGERRVGECQTAGIRRLKVDGLQDPAAGQAWVHR